VPVGDVFAAVGAEGLEVDEVVGGGEEFHVADEAEVEDRGDAVAGLDGVFECGLEVCDGVSEWVLRCR